MTSKYSTQTTLKTVTRSRKGAFLLLYYISTPHETLMSASQDKLVAQLAAAGHKEIVVIQYPSQASTKRRKPRKVKV